MNKQVNVFARQTILPSLQITRWYAEPSDNPYLFELQGCKTMDDATAVAKRVFPDHDIIEVKGADNSRKVVAYEIKSA